MVAGTKIEINRTKATLLAVFLLGGAALLQIRFRSGAVTTLGATAIVTEQQTGISFKSRVDTGAAITAIHCPELFNEGEVDNPLKNLGKTVLVQIENERGERQTINTEIVDHAKIRSIDAANSRYYVRMRLRCEGIEKNTLVTLSDRRQMKYKLILGRDFLEG